VSLLGDDEMAVAGRELAYMQQELREALWRNARLAALGSAVAQVSHDLRNILSSAMLAADRLSACEDPAIRRSGEVLVRSIERALEIARRTLDYAREGPPALVRAPFALAHLIDELRETALTGMPASLIVADLPPGLTLEADREQIFRIFTNLLRNAFEAGARRVIINARVGEHDLEIDIADDGPGLPEAVRRNLFRPFAVSSRRGGSGLGLAIARDLARAHGGELVLVKTDESGTTFRLSLPLAMVSGFRPSSPPS
jgi:signal transduction histidine kinase